MITLYDNSLHREEVIQLWKSIFGYKDKRNDPASAIDRKLAVKDGLFFVAVNNCEVIGTIMAGYDGHRGWIYSLAMLPEKRNSGIGSELLAHAERELARRGCVKINLQILSTNSAVEYFYKKNGYKTEERISMGKEIKSLPEI